MRVGLLWNMKWSDLAEVCRLLRRVGRYVIPRHIRLPSVFCPCSYTRKWVKNFCKWLNQSLAVNKKKDIEKCLLTLYLQPGTGSPFLTAGPTVGSSLHAAPGSAPSSSTEPGDLETNLHRFLSREACSVTPSMGSTSSLAHKYLLRKVQIHSPQAGGCSLQWP